MEGLLSVVLESASGSQFGCWLGCPAAQNPHSLDPPCSHPCRGMWTLAVTPQPCSSCTPLLILFSSGLATDVVELDGGGAMVAELDGCGAAVVPSKPSRSVGSSRSTGVGEGKSAIRDSVLSCCC